MSALWAPFFFYRRSSRKGNRRSPSLFAGLIKSAAQKAKSDVLAALKMGREQNKGGEAVRGWALAPNPVPRC